MLAARHRNGPRGQAGAGRIRDDGLEGRDPRALGENYPITPEGARRRLPDGPAPPLDALFAAARGPARALGARAGDRRLLLRAGVRPDRFADPDRRPGRGNLDALRDGLLRREGLPLAVGTAVSRARGGGVRQGLLLRADLPRREVQDAPPPDRVLDGRARGGVSGVRGPLRARRGLHRVARRAGRSTAARRTSKRLERDTAKLEAVEDALSADDVSRGDREARGRRGSR